MRRIVVGLDGSAASTRALRWAFEKAGLHAEAEVTAVHAYDLPERRGGYAYTESYLPAGALARRSEEEQRAHAEAEEAAVQRAQHLISEALAEEGTTPAGVSVEPLVVAGDPARTLVEMSRDADLLVVGSRGLGGFHGLLVGSVSQKCLHHAHCPVVVVR